MISGRWFRRERVWSVLKDITSSIGLFSVIIAVVEFFPTLDKLNSFLKLKSSFFVLVTCSLVYSLIKNRPRNKFIFKVNNRDVELALRIGDIENLKTSYIVPVNSEFDMNLNGSVKFAKSIKSMVIRKYFAGDHDALQKKISQVLKTKYYLSLKENGKYRLGTTVRIETDDKRKIFYFVVNSHKINDSRVEADEKNLADTLNGLWSHISSHGAKEHLAIPLLGTGNGRLKMSRDEVYKEIIRSFLASCAGKIYCECMNIVIRDEDVTRFKINIDDLADFMRLQTTYADFTHNTIADRGNPIG